MDLSTWPEVFKYIVIFIVALGGSPIMQLMKVFLSWIFKKPIEDRIAIAVCGIVAALMAVLEMLLTGALKVPEITPQSFPTLFFAAYGIAQLYYGWFKDTPNVFGTKFLLPKPEFYRNLLVAKNVPIKAKKR